MKRSIIIHTFYTLLYIIMLVDCIYSNYNKMIIFDYFAYILFLQVFIIQYIVYHIFYSLELSENNNIVYNFDIYLIYIRIIIIITVSLCMLLKISIINHLYLCEIIAYSFNFNFNYSRFISYYET